MASDTSRLRNFKMRDSKYNALVVMADLKGISAAAYMNDLVDKDAERVKKKQAIKEGVDADTYEFPYVLDEDGRKIKELEK